MSPEQERDSRILARDTDLRPIPDPTELTNLLVEKAITALRNELRALIDGQVQITDTRLSGMDKAVELLQTARDKMPAEIQGQVLHLKDLQDEKFRSIQTQFLERDTRAEQTARDSKVAVDAALQAAKEAVGKQNEASDRSIQKSETATTKQIDQQGLRIDDLKERLTRIEGEGRGQLAARTTQETSNTSQLGWVGLILGTLVGIGGLLAAFLR